MEFEFDPAKSKVNAAKHGVDFVRAQRLWADEDRLTVPARSESESRHLLIARLDGKLWAAVYTQRGGKIRIISVRRARGNEKEHYEQNQSEDDGGELGGEV